MGPTGADRAIVVSVSVNMYNGVLTFESVEEILSATFQTKSS